MKFHHGLLVANRCILMVLDYCVEHDQEMLDHECSDSGGHEQYWYRASIGVTRLPSTPNAKLVKHKGTQL